MSEKKLKIKEIEALLRAQTFDYSGTKHYGPRGGWLGIGWATTGLAHVTIACKKAGIPTRCSWSGKWPTPTTLIPEVVRDFLAIEGVI